MCWLFWDKGTGENDFSDGELAWTSFDLNTKTYRGRINDYEGTRMHPTQKSIGLFSWCIKNYSKQSNTIFDPFAGSGTTGVAAINTNRNYILIEQEQKYVDVIKNRILEVENNMKEINNEQR
jgi:DNA modification methylase